MRLDAMSVFVTMSSSGSEPSSIPWSLSAWSSISTKGALERLSGALALNCNHLP